MRSPRIHTRREHRQEEAIVPVETELCNKKKRKISQKNRDRLKWKFPPTKLQSREQCSKPYHLISAPLIAMGD